MRRAELGDTVRIVGSPATIAAGYADRTGTCYGFTTPSVTGVRVIRPALIDDALSVGFHDGTSAWFDPSLVAFLDVHAGLMATVGHRRFVRSQTGDWVEAPESD
jgi:hypothetical protein